MTVTYFATFRHDGVVGAEDLQWLERLLAATPGLARGLIYTPAQTHDPYLDDGRPPALAVQLYFPDIAALEAALAHGGHLQALAAPDALPSLRGAAVTQQAMLARAFAVPDARSGTASGEPGCTYLVTYEGAAADQNAWVAHYIEHHTAIMARFPGIREVEVATRIDWCGFLPWPRVDAMLRNKVVFDDAAALTAALNSPVRHDMRADFQRFPAFTGTVTHFPMATENLAHGVGLSRASDRRETREGRG
ncbi:MAG: EthD family reductase [Acetobacteraceae bacterium]